VQKMQWYADSFNLIKLKLIVRVICCLIAVALTAKVFYLITQPASSCSRILTFFLS